MRRCVPKMVEVLRSGGKVDGCVLVLATRVVSFCW